MDPITLNVRLQDTGFTQTEAGIFIYQHTRRLPARMSELVITWRGNMTTGDRFVTFSVGGKDYVTIPVQPHYRENQMELIMLWLDKPEQLALRDIKRTIALGLTAAYKEKIQELWTR